MTWEFQAMISDDVCTVIGPAGESAWGIDNGDVDAGSPESLGTAEVDLPTGRRTLLLVRALPGGLVLDVVRAYQGLTEPELCTLFLGVVSELGDCSRPEERLSLRAFGLDSVGRPTLIPGITTALVTSPRRAVGEMLYHAAVGRPWAECLLPVNLALSDSSQTLRAVVADLLADSSADSGLSAALTEVAEAMRALAVPVPLPLVPADRDLAPETALTARLRAASDHPLGRVREQRTEALVGTADGVPAGYRPEASLPAEVRLAAVGRTTLGAGHGTAATGAEPDSEPAGPTPPHQGSPATALRAASRRSQRRRSGSRPRRAMPAIRRWVLGLFEARPHRLKPSFRSRWFVAAALCLTVVGGFVVWRSWTAADSAQPTEVVGSQNEQSPHTTQDPEAEPGPEREPGPEKEASPDEEANDAAQVSAEDVADVLTRLCADRAQALSDGDAAALSELTVPGSAAAAADELIDHAVYAGSEYSIEVDAVNVVEVGENRIVASATMHSSAGTGASAEDFGAQSVEFVLKRLGEAWRVEQVTERASSS
ncbi:hypothetical protein [Brevibacterium spongiae]|uniref:DUF4440 domain-containing protein n=1 Tax=Brevibacterium spongiae TaxID=2909672 RepID=A0ABY5SYL5_9MICO|nr:hypothetical protein [Brevibacterium spongiae]UVI37789.1 hypothetical protein L1F31_09150 [Brevibacterium spongiae]